MRGDEVGEGGGGGREEGEAGGECEVDVREGRREGAEAVGGGGQSVELEMRVGLVGWWIRGFGV